jgi:hypothetical protein
MRRGTIGLFGEAEKPDILPTFRYAGQYSPLFLRLYLSHLTELGFDTSRIPESFDRYAGDFLELGKGEILTPQFAV